jgi:hypothetical protein
MFHKIPLYKWQNSHGYLTYAGRNTFIALNILPMGRNAAISIIWNRKVIQLSKKFSFFPMFSCLRKRRRWIDTFQA